MIPLKIYFKVINTARKEWEKKEVREAWGEENYKYFIRAVIDQYKYAPRIKRKTKHKHLWVLGPSGTHFQCSICGVVKKDILYQIHRNRIQTELRKTYFDKKLALEHGEVPWQELNFQYFLSTGKHFIPPEHLIGPITANQIASGVKKGRLNEHGKYCTY